MKKIFLLLLLGSILTSFNLISQPSKFNIAGKWTDNINRKNGYMNFDNDGFVTIELNDGKTIGGKRFENDGEIFSLYYEVKYETEPKQIDVIFTKLNSGDQMTWKWIFEIINDNKIRLAKGKNNASRPNDFTESVIFERIK